MESLKFFINLYGSPKVLYLDLLLFYHIGFDEFFFVVLFYFIRTYIYIYIYHHHHRRRRRRHRHCINYATYQL